MNEVVALTLIMCLYPFQSRQDRDTYVTIHTSEIESGKEHNFDKYESIFGQDHDNYDYGSVMHYSADAFDKGSNPTITVNPTKFSEWQAAGPLNWGADFTGIGQRAGLSRNDIKGAQVLYGDGETCLPDMNMAAGALISLFMRARHMLWWRAG